MVEIRGALFKVTNQQQEKKSSGLILGGRGGGAQVKYYTKINIGGKT